MREYAIQFGHGRQLAGIITEPSTPRRDVVCVLITAGLAPKFGPFRLYAKLARRLASAGFVTLRFDLGGIGDSGQAFTGAPLKTRTMLEIRAAVDFMFGQYGISDFAVCGSCSGAEAAFRYSEGDNRVRAVAMIDPFSYRTEGWAWRHFLHRLERRALRALGLYKPLEFSSVSNSRPDQPEGLVKYQYIEPEESRRILAGLIARKTRVHFVYTGAMLDTFNHRGQLKKMFPGLDTKNLMTLDHFPQTEHSPVLEPYRQLLVEAIGRRVEQSFPAANSV